MRKFLLPLLFLFAVLQPAFAHVPEKKAPFARQDACGPITILPSLNISPDTLILNLLGMVNEDSLAAVVKKLQDYGTRMCTSPEAFLAQAWIQNKLLSFGYSVALQDFPNVPGSSDNVIATKTGLIHPNEYVVLGAHYDSYTGSTFAPGADDNASGSAGILEIARVLSQHSFDRSIILCLWSAEELGLYGSGYFANDAALNGMNILGYLNMDMCGYQYGSQIKTNVMGPVSAEPLVDLYAEVCAVYLPDFTVIKGGTIPGSSDHASFNSAGYMGIFPFEDEFNYSPYIHTGADTIGTSVNSFPMVATFTKAILSTAVEMLNRIPAPVNLIAYPGLTQVSLQWASPNINVSEYKIYRDDFTTPLFTTADTFFVDNTVMSDSLYKYAVTAVGATSGKESPLSNIVLIRAMAPISFPFHDNFENGLDYWMTENDWALTTTAAHSASHSLTDSPGGDYNNNARNTIYLLPVNLNDPPVAGASLSFWTIYDTESGYDSLILEVSKGGIYKKIAGWSGSQATWTMKTISLNDFVGEAWVSLRFSLLSDEWYHEDGAYVDDLSISVITSGIQPLSNSSLVLSEVFPNPSVNECQLLLENTLPGKISFSITNTLGEEIFADGEKTYEGGKHNISFNTQDFSPGLYIIQVASDEGILQRKFIVK